jgi:lysophospholipase L1-like esterase
VHEATCNPAWRRYVALGDSFTEGLSDPDPQRPGAYRGWADRLAGHLAAAAEGDVEYANLAVRGRLVGQVLDEQLPVALDARPDLVSLVAGGNDLLRPGGDPDTLADALDRAVARLRSAGADVLLATGVDPRNMPIIRRIRGRVAVFNAHLGRGRRGGGVGAGVRRPLGGTAAARPLLG